MRGGLPLSEVAAPSPCPDDVPDWDFNEPVLETKPEPESELEDDPALEQRLYLEELKEVWGVMVEENAAKAMAAAGWDCSRKARAISHKDNPAKVIAEIVHALFLEHNRLCMQSNSIKDMFHNRIALDQAMEMEWSNRGPKRNYDPQLRVAGVYHTEKRELMQKCGYSERQRMQQYEVPKREGYVKELLDRSTHIRTLFTHLFDLCRTSRDVFADLSVADINVTLLLRLVYLDEARVGVRGAHVIRNLASHWQEVRDSECCVTVGYEPQRVELRGTFAQAMHYAGFIILSWGRWDDETQPPATINIVSNFPPPGMRSLPWFAKNFGFKTVEDKDHNGKNIFHHLFTAVKYSRLAGEIALECFRPEAEKLPGNYTMAMSHTVTGRTPRGWTPLHCLAHGSDVLLLNRCIMKELLDNKIVDVAQFDSCTNDKVSVFC